MAINKKDSLKNLTTQFLFIFLGLTIWKYFEYLGIFDKFNHTSYYVSFIIVFGLIIFLNIGKTNQNKRLKD